MHLLGVKKICILTETWRSALLCMYVCTYECQTHSNVQSFRHLSVWGWDTHIFEDDCKNVFPTFFHMIDKYFYLLHKIAQSIIFLVCTEKLYNIIPFRNRIIWIMTNIFLVFIFSKCLVKKHTILLKYLFVCFNDGMKTYMFIWYLLSQ